MPLLLTGAGSGTPGGTSPPAAVTNLVATAGDQIVNLTWDASGGAEEYKIYASLTDVFGTATEVTGSPEASTNFGVNSLQAGELYYFWVVASNAVGDSAESTSDSARPYVTVPSSGNANLITPTGSWTLGTLLFGADPSPLPDNLYIEADAILYLTFGGVWLDATTEDPANSVSISGAFAFTNNSGASFSLWTTEP